MSVCTADLLRAAWPRHTAKQAARAAGTTTRTAEGWLAGREPAAGILIRMAARNATLRAELMRAIEGSPHAPVVSPRRRMDRAAPVQPGLDLGGLGEGAHHGGGA